SEQPIEMGVEEVVTGPAGEARERRHDDGAFFRKAVEERNPPRQPAETGKEAEKRPRPLAPHPARMAIDLDGPGFGVGHAGARLNKNAPLRPFGAERLGRGGVAGEAEEGAVDSAAPGRKHGNRLRLARIALGHPTSPGLS